jgi:hypothetical protein
MFTRARAVSTVSLITATGERCESKPDHEEHCSPSHRVLRIDNLNIVVFHGSGYDCNHTRTVTWGRLDIEQIEENRLLSLQIMPIPNEPPAARSHLHSLELLRKNRKTLRERRVFTVESL